MEEDILNYSSTVMSRGTASCIYIYLVFTEINQIQSRMN